jgi:argininosuccinate synthase
VKRIVLAFSGSDDGAAAVGRLRSEHGAEVVTVTLDFGQGSGLEAIRDHALSRGAARAHVLDMREEFARHFILPTLRADALEEGRIPMGAALSRAAIAHKLVQLAGIEQATTVAHGGAAGVDGRASVDACVRMLSPSLEVVALPAAHPAPSRVELNIWGRYVEGGGVARPYALTKPPRECPDQPVALDLTFARGVPVSVNGVDLPLLELFDSVGVLAGAHGVGRCESDAPSAERFVEAPAAVVLHAAHRELQARVSAPEAERVARVASREYAELVCAGRWFTPLRGALDAFVDRLQEQVSGVVRVQLCQGACRILS